MLTYSKHPVPVEIVKTVTTTLAGADFHSLRVSIGFGDSYVPAEVIHLFCFATSVLTLVVCVGSPGPAQQCDNLHSRPPDPVRRT